MCNEKWNNWKEGQWLNINVTDCISNISKRNLRMKTMQFIAENQIKTVLTTHVIQFIEKP